MAQEEKTGKSWVVTFLLTLALWGGVLLGMIILGHNLALRISGH